MIETADRELSDRTVAFLLQGPVSDGGQWNMFVNLVRKYGLPPKTAMPETESSSHTHAMNSLLVAKLRLGAMQLRDLRRSGSGGLERCREAKAGLMGEIYRILRIHLGAPPSKFVWQWREDKGKKTFRRDDAMTPLAFAKKYVTLPLDEYVCLVNDPRPSSPYGRTFTVEYLGNVVGGKPVVYLNVDIATMKRIALQILRDKEPVWFGCDVGKMMDREAGLLDANLRDYEGLYGMPLAMDKASRLLYGAGLHEPRDAVHGRGHPARTPPAVARGEQLGREGGAGRVLPDERLVVRRAHVRDCRPPGLPVQVASRRLEAQADRAARLGSDGVPGPVAVEGTGKARSRDVRRATGV